MAGVNVTTLQGTLRAGPSSSSCSGSFPSGLVNVTFESSPARKSTPVSCYHVRAVNSPASYAALAGIGTNETVTQALILYLKTSGPMLVRITTEETPDDVVSVIPVDGLMILEFQAARYLKLVEVQGSGTVEYFAGGPT